MKYIVQYSVPLTITVDVEVPADEDPWDYEDDAMRLADERAPKIGRLMKAAAERWEGATVTEDPSYEDMDWQGE